MIFVLENRILLINVIHCCLIAAIA